MKKSYILVVDSCFACFDIVESEVEREDVVADYGDDDWVKEEGYGFNVSLRLRFLLWDMLNLYNGLKSEGIFNIL